MFDLIVNFCLFQSPPYIFLETYSNRTTLFTGGIEFEFLNALKNYFEFNYHAIDCNSNWGSFINGTWTGVVGNVLYKVS